MKLFIASHGKMASGIKSSLDVLIGNTENITIFDAFIDERSVKDELDLFYQKVGLEDQVILLSDLYGGSVNATMFQFLSQPNTSLITGINLALVLELAIKDKCISDSELESLVINSRELMKVVKNDGNMSTGDDDFF